MSTDAERSPGQAPELHDSAWQSEVGRPLLIAIQMTCLIAGPLAVVIGVTGDLRMRSIGVLAFAAALAGVYTNQWLATPSQRATRKAAFALAELVALILVLRVATWGLAGNWPTAAAVYQWLLDPASFLDGFFLTAVLLSALAWQRAGIVADLFYRLALTPGELAWVEEQRMGAWLRGNRMSDRAQISRQEMVDSYINQWLIGGFLVVFCAGATRVKVDPDASIHLFSTGVPDRVIVAVVMYFLTGLVLISQARLAQMRALWHFDGVEAPPGLPARWTRLSLVVVVGVGLAASLLPLGSTWQLGAMINIVLGVIVQIVTGIIGLLIALFSAILLLLGRPPEALPELPLINRPAAPPPPLPTVELPTWLGGATIWLLTLAVLALALRFLVGPEGLEVTRRRLAALGRRIVGLLTRWWMGARAAAHDLAAASLRRRAADGNPPGSQRTPWRFVRLSALSPRDRVRYFYLSTVRRAGRQGTVRRAGQTPAEFLRDLESGWPEAELDVVALTDAFVRARYSRDEVSLNDAQDARTVWERIKQALRQRRAPTTQPSAEGRDSADA